MELRQIKYFLEVAQNLHFGKAAERLYISQSALSQQIKALEENLGVKLLDETARKQYRKVKLTPAGEYLLQEGKKLINQANKLEENTRRVSQERQIIKLGVYKAILKERIVEFMEEFSKVNPNAEIAISEYENYTQVQESLLSQEIDQGLSLLPIISEKIKYNVLTKGGLSLIMSKTHDAEKFNMPIEELLKNEKWIELSRNIHPVYHEIEECCKEMQIKRQIIQEVSSLNLLISLVGLGHGIAFAPTLFNFRSEPKILVKDLSDTIFKSIVISHIVVNM